MAVRVRMGSNAAVKLLPSGKHTGVLLDAEIQPAKSDDKFPYLQVNFTTEDAEMGEKKVRCFFSFSPKAVWRIVQVMERLDIPFTLEKVVVGQDADGNDIEEEDLAFEVEDWNGKSCIAEISCKETKKGDKTYNNNNVDDLLAPI